MRLDMLSVGLVVSLGLCGIGLAAAQETAPQGAANPGPWAVTPVAMCRFEIDVRQMGNPHVALGQLLGGRQTVCPFFANQSSPAIALVMQWGKTCKMELATGLRANNATALNFSQFASQTVACDPMYRQTTPEASSAPGAVFVITAREHVRATPFDTQEFSQHENEVHRLLTAGGLPISYADGWGENDIHYFCFEMMKGADVDPLAFLRSGSPWLSREGKEHRSGAPNCVLATRQFGVEAPRRGPATRVTPETYSLSIRRSTASHDHEPYRAAVLDSFQRSGLQTQKVAADPAVHSILPDQDTYSTYKLLPEHIGDQYGIIRFNYVGLSLHVPVLTSRLCEAIYSALRTTDSFILQADESAPNIAPEGVHGSPPEHQVLTDLTWVHDPTELCRALQPSFDRWRIEASQPVDR